MINFEQLLNELGACNEAVIWADDMPIEEVVEKCHRGDWLLWLAKEVDMDIKPLTLAKAMCAKTVIHLMKDQRSVDAVNLAEKFGLTDEVSLDDLKKAADAADAAYAAVYVNAADVAAAYTAYTAVATAYTTYAAVYAADAAYAAAYSAAADVPVYTADAARIKNQKQTADICRETLGSLLIQLVNNKLK